MHKAITQQILKLLPKEDIDFVKIKEETQNDVIEIFESVVNQEKAFAKYIFSKGSMIGLNESLTCSFVEELAGKQMTNLGIPTKYKHNTKVLPWTQKWISGADVQVAPQETEITSYIIGGMDNNIDKNTFKGFEL